MKIVRLIAFLAGCAGLYVAYVAASTNAVILGFLVAVVGLTIAIAGNGMRKS